MLRIAVTGKPGVGKSTILARVVEKLDLKACGIRAVEEVLDSDRPILAVLHRSSKHPLARR